MSRIDTVFLDAGGVLVFPNWTRIGDALAQRGVTVDAARLAAAEPFAKREIDIATTIGATDDRARSWLYFELIFEKAGVAVTDAVLEALADVREYHRRENLWELVPDDVRPSLERLRALVRRLVVVSNANGALHTLFDRLDLSRWFDVVLDSHVEGVEKPDPRLFQIALERAGAEASDTVHVGDLYHVDVVGARSAGLRAFLINPCNLYEGYDCPRSPSLPGFVDWVAAQNRS